MGNIYDGAFRTILNDCRKLIIPIINEIFGEEYTGEEEVEFFPNEHFIDQQDTADQERITDTNFAVVGRTKKKLLLIPFYIFTHEKRFPEYNSNKQKLSELKAEYQDILERLDELEGQGMIGGFDKRTIIELSADVMKEIARKYENVQKGVGDIMSGAMLETSARKIRDEAKREVVISMLKMGKLTIEEIAQCSELSVAEVERLAKIEAV